LATPVKPGEYVPKDQLIEFEVTTLAVPVTRNEFYTLQSSQRVLDDATPDKFYRKVRSTDKLSPKSTVVTHRKVQFRTVDIGDRVKKDQILGVINPALAVAELGIKHHNVDGAAADVRQSLALQEEYYRRTKQMERLRSIMKGTVTDDEFYAARATAD